MRGLKRQDAHNSNRDWGKGTLRATPGRQWFWVLLPKQKELVVRGRNPAKESSRRAGAKPRMRRQRHSGSAITNVGDKLGDDEGGVGN